MGPVTCEDLAWASTWVCNLRGFFRFKREEMSATIPTTDRRCETSGWVNVNNAGLVDVPLDDTLDGITATDTEGSEGVVGPPMSW